jgi:hypothetical protein
MTDFAHPDRPDLRLSNAERDVAVARLAEAQAEGRFSATEYAERAAAARAAVTRGDLVPLFADLPAGTGAALPGPVLPGPVLPDPLLSDPLVPPAFAPPLPGPPLSAPEPHGRSGRQPLGGAVGATVMALIPFLALGLFFLTGHFGSYGWSWIWFLLIPIAGIVIYGPGSEYRRRD